MITLLARNGYVNTDVDNDHKTYRHTIGMNFRPVETVAYKLAYQIDNKDQKNVDTSTSSIVGSIAVGF